MATVRQTKRIEVKRIIGLTIIFLFACSCNEWTAVPIDDDDGWTAATIESDIDQNEEDVAPIKENQQNYISLARVSFQRDDMISRSMVHVRLSDGKSIWTFEGDDLNSAREVQTLMSGNLNMDFTIRTNDGYNVSHGRASWALKPDCLISISIYRSSHARPCWGCKGSKSFPIESNKFKSNEKDAIFVQWGVNSISHPVRY